jgi:putative ABC transport system permease protein
LGAQRRDIVQMIVSQGMRLVVLGTLLGLIGAGALTGVIERLLFNVKPLDPITFIAVTIVLAAVAFLASFVPARRAASIQPVEALRYE